MSNRALYFGKQLLLIWGGFSLVIVAGIVALIAYQIGPAYYDENKLASPNDVRFVLNWCGLGEKRIERVLQSHISPRSITGDHLDAHAIKISKVEVSELESKVKDIDGRWYRGDHLPQVLTDAISFVSIWHDEIPWFPTEAEVKSSNFYIFSWSIYLHGVKPSAAEIIFVRPSDNIIFYFGGKT